MLARGQVGGEEGVLRPVELVAVDVEQVAALGRTAVDAVLQDARVEADDGVDADRGTGEVQGQLAFGLRGLEHVHWRREVAGLLGAPALGDREAALDLRGLGPDEASVLEAERVQFGGQGAWRRGLECRVGPGLVEEADDALGVESAAGVGRVDHVAAELLPGQLAVADPFAHFLVQGQDRDAVTFGHFLVRLDKWGNPTCLDVLGVARVGEVEHDDVDLRVEPPGLAHDALHGIDAAAVHGKLEEEEVDAPAAKDIAGESESAQVRVGAADAGHDKIERRCREALSEVVHDLLAPDLGGDRAAHEGNADRPALAEGRIAAHQVAAWGEVGEGRRHRRGLLGAGNAELQVVDVVHRVALGRGDQADPGQSLEAVVQRDALLVCGLVRQDEANRCGPARRRGHGEGDLDVGPLVQWQRGNARTAGQIHGPTRSEHECRAGDERGVGPVAQFDAEVGRGGRRVADIEAEGDLPARDGPFAAQGVVEVRPPRLFQAGGADHLQGSLAARRRVLRDLDDGTFLPQLRDLAGLRRHEADRAFLKGLEEWGEDLVRRAQDRCHAEGCRSPCCKPGEGVEASGEPSWRMPHHTSISHLQHKTCWTAANPLAGPARDNRFPQLRLNANMGRWATARKRVNARAPSGSGPESGLGSSRRA